MVEPETFAFLTDLAADNRKVWMDAHRKERDDALRNFTGIAMTLHDYADRFDFTVAESKIKPKQSYSKFFQDARDRVGKGLYRTDIDVFANAGDPSENVGYYLHIEPGNCHAGAGIFTPSKEGLASLRTCLLDDPEGFDELISDADFQAAFPTGIISRRTLDAVPDGIECTAENAAYMKMLGFGCAQSIPDEALLDDDVIDQIIEIFRSASPLVRYFN